MNATLNEKGEVEKVYRADTDGQLYKNSDLVWAFEPTEEDPGWTAPKPGAIPVEPEELI